VYARYKLPALFMWYRFKKDQGVNSVEQEAVDAASLRTRRKKRGRRAKEQIDLQDETVQVDSQDGEEQIDASPTAISTEEDNQEKDDIPVIRYTPARQMRDDIISQEQTILVQRTIRSGQRVFYPGNVVVLGDVNPGGEVIAGGNIIVMGTFRGIAHAGALGKEDAIIAALHLEPSQLRIAGYITRAPEGDYSSAYQPEIARVQDGIVIIEQYQPGYDLYHRGDRKRGSING
jgi:septum site-determining protein MinC